MPRWNRLSLPDRWQGWELPTALYPETLEHQVEGIAIPVRGRHERRVSREPVARPRLRNGLEEELIRCMRAEGNAPTIRAIASAIARVLEQDHLEMVEQLERAGVRLGPAEQAGPAPPES